MTEQRVVELTKRLGVLRAQDLASIGVARTYLQRLCDRGVLVALGQGLYQLVDAIPSEHQTLVEVARRVPQGVVCLLSALRFHEIGTQEPPAVWLALPSGSRTPRFAYPPLEIVRVSGVAWQAGTEVHELSVGEGKVSVRITTPAKSVADCFKFRSRVGLDVALEALQDVVRHKRASVDELWHCAEIDRITSVLRPYLEAMLVR